MIILDIEQGSEEWCNEKLGKPSASNASRIITSDGKPSKQREGYLYELAAEAIMRSKPESYTNGHMLLGEEREHESRQCYELVHGVDVKTVGVIYKDDARRFLCSPDGIVGDVGLELKNVLPKTQVKYLLKGVLPAEYFGQVQFSMYVTGFKRWDFMSYCPGLKPLIVQVDRDDAYISKLDAELGRFCDDLASIIEKVK